MSRKRLFGATLLVAGTSIGAGMLALPIVTAEGGFFPALSIFFLSWLFMTSTGLLLLEIALRLPPDANLISMASIYLGKGGKYLTWVLYLFLFYCLSVAYIAGGGALLRGWVGFEVPPWIASLFFLLVLAPVVYRGAKQVDNLNRFLMIGLLASYFAFVFFGAFSLNLKNFERGNFGKALFALPVIFTSFSYQGVIPSLTAYLRRDAKELRQAIVGGTTIAFFIYVIWNCLILGMIPLEGKEGLLAAKHLGQTAVFPLSYHAKNSFIPLIGQGFAFFAIATSFLGVTLGLFDCLADGLKMPKKGGRKLFLALLTFLPPSLIAFTKPAIFISALTLAGGIGCALLLGFFPIAMAWVSRYRKKEDPLGIQFFGGKVALVLLFAFLLAELAIEIFPDFARFLP